MRSEFRTHIHFRTKAESLLINRPFHIFASLVVIEIVAVARR